MPKAIMDVALVRLHEALDLPPEVTIRAVATGDDYGLSYDCIRLQLDGVPDVPEVEPNRKLPRVDAIYEREDRVVFKGFRNRG